MGLVTMQFRQPPERSSNPHGIDDDDRPHDERAAEAWTMEAREAVARKLMLGCHVPAQELEDARLTMKEARALAVDIERRLEADHKRLTIPPEPKDVQGVPVFTYVPDSEPVHENPAPKRRRRKRRVTSKSISRQAIEFRNEEQALFND